VRVWDLVTARIVMEIQQNSTLWEFAIRRGSELLRSFYTAPGDFSGEEKLEVAQRLGLGNSSDLHFEVTSYAKSQLVLERLRFKRFTVKSGTEFWFERRI
jgi:hypothetical protein